MRSAAAIARPKAKVALERPDSRFRGVAFIDQELLPGGGPVFRPVVAVEVPS
jgi:hypothetical protein